MTTDPSTSSVGTAKRRTNYTYTWRCGWRWVWEDIKYRRGVVVALRTFYWAILRGWDGEACQDCGSPYLHWRAPDDLYAQVIGSRGGLFCLRCFDRRAEAVGLMLLWRPEVFRG